MDLLFSALPSNLPFLGVSNDGLVLVTPCLAIFLWEAGNDGLEWTCCFRPCLATFRFLGVSNDGWVVVPPCLAIFFGKPAMMVWGGLVVFRPCLATFLFWEGARMVWS